MPTKPRPSLSLSETVRNYAVAAAGVIASILIPALGAYYAHNDKNKEVSESWVDLGVKILSEEPKPTNQPLRKWAADLIRFYSEVPLTNEAEKVLLNEPLFQRGVSTRVLDDLSSQGYLLGLTLSRFDGVLDYAALQKKGMRFAYIRASQGVSRKDSASSVHTDGASAAGMQIGYYHFFVPGDDNEKQADNFIAELDKYKGKWQLPPVIDCEDSPSAPMTGGYKDQLFDFLTLLQKRTGYRPVIYTTPPFANEHMDQRFSAFPLLLARYLGSNNVKVPPMPKWWTAFAFWHFAESVEDPALKDRSVFAFKGDAAALTAFSAQSRVAPAAAPQ